MRREEDRKSTRLNSSHMSISYAVFCLKKKKTAHLPEFVPDQIKEHVVLRTLLLVCEELRAKTLRLRKGRAQRPRARNFFFLMIRRPPRSTLFPHDALPI